MSRRIFGLALVVGFGVLNGYVTFQPAFDDLEREKWKQGESAAADLPTDMVEIQTQSTQPNANGTVNPSKDVLNK
ncbi:hypothetical protein LTR84_008676 [Exophiala bonariae]|uniref:Uncharacterized protein n=1 Tax=Exophiala bonariae TaxID=1690606 RepID=A0AAV9MWI8_9EURO|nr:hypothetical protein LTR84_008676 [Exophiala bonariae]